MKKLIKITSLPVALFFIIAVSASPQHSQAQSTPKLNNAQVASVAVVANKIDIQYAKLAKKKSNTPAVTAFASTMIDNHKQVINEAVALAKKLGVTPESNALSKQLKENADKTAATLREKSGVDFDKAYIDNEVAYHKAVIDVVENTLIPDAANEQLKGLLKKALVIFKGHLGYAEVLQKDLGK